MNEKCIAWDPICHMRRVSTSANGWVLSAKFAPKTDACPATECQLVSFVQLVAPWSLTIFKTSSKWNCVMFEGTIWMGSRTLVWFSRICLGLGGFLFEGCSSQVRGSVRPVCLPKAFIAGGPRGNNFRAWLFFLVLYLANEKHVRNLGCEICGRTCTASPMFLVRLVASIIFS